MSNWSFQGMASSLPSSSCSALRQFSLAEIIKATNNFHESLVIRRGFSSVVYKGTYKDHDGTEKFIVIKKLQFMSSSRQPHPLWFDKKLDAWSQYRHKHVVAVIGYCREHGSNIVVYEYMPNGSLSNHLCTKITPASFSLSWEQCLHILIDGARGLEFMHTHIRFSNGDSFSHGDVTPSNILLDGNGVAKISDLYYEPFTREHKSACLFDPEYTGGTNKSSDVYAFGVLLVKMLTRKVLFDLEDKNLGIRLSKCITDRTIHQMIQPDIKAQASPDSLEAFIQIAGECLNNELLRRPSFTQVVKNLELLTAQSTQRSCQLYSLDEIKYFTKDFTAAVLGKGGEGTVYKGVTKTNTLVAVKRLNPKLCHELKKELEKEIKMLSNLNHPNVLSLVGKCQEPGENILVYDFMCNGNLFQNLYSDTRSLSWQQRLNICVGAARGLRYLHTRTNTSEKGIVHRDVKPVNILLDSNFNAKISDFGLSKMGPEQQANSEISTMIKGTTGYYAPEYQRYGKITRRIDVYAFGIVLTEVLCKKKPWDRGEESFYPTENEEYVQWAKENIDPDLEGEVAPGCLDAFTGILEKCLNVDPKRRPNMNDVVLVLEYAVEWQEAWQRHKSGGEFYLPCGKDRVVLYSSPNFQEHYKIRSLLRSYKVHVDERDLRKNLYAADFKHVPFKENEDKRQPQLFVSGEYIGDSDEMKQLHESGELSKILGAPGPKFICDTCREVRTCDVCKQTKRFDHCNNCDALTETWESWEGQFRSCLECDGDDQAIHILSTTKKVVRRIR